MKVNDLIMSTLLIVYSLACLGTAIGIIIGFAYLGFRFVTEYLL